MGPRKQVRRLSPNGAAPHNIGVQPLTRATPSANSRPKARLISARTLAYLALLHSFAHQNRIQALKMALIGATTVMLAEGSSMAATISVYPPDGEGRVFVDVVGKIDDEDYESFKEKTDQIYRGAGDPKKLVIVTLISNGGAIGPAMDIGRLVHKRGM